MRSRQSGPGAFSPALAATPLILLKAGRAVTPALRASRYVPGAITQLISDQVVRAPTNPNPYDDQGTGSLRVEYSYSKGSTPDANEEGRYGLSSYIPSCRKRLEASDASHAAQVDQS